MKFSDVMAFYDYKMINVAKGLSISRETVKVWKQNDYIPFRMQCVIEVLSDGKLKADRK